MTWKEAQEWEEDWWGNCQNTYGEEEKQLLYANRMGLKLFHNGKSPYNIDLGGKDVLDIGGGPASLLLKCVNFSTAMVIDPLRMPPWVLARYTTANILFGGLPGEEIQEGGWDEVWIYNVLQHSQNPATIIRQAQAAADVIRIFEWIDTEINIGHPHSLTEEKLNEWLGGEGKVEILNGQANCYGKCFHGIFPTK